MKIAPISKGMRGVKSTPVRPCFPPTHLGVAYPPTSCDIVVSVPRYIIEVSYKVLVTSDRKLCWAI